MFKELYLYHHPLLRWMILCVKLSNIRPKPSFKLIKPHMVEFANISSNIGAH
jgi:hypothetical protein